MFEKNVDMPNRERCGGRRDEEKDRKDELLVPMKEREDCLQNLLKRNIYTEINVQRGILLVLFKSITFWSKRGVILVGQN